MSRTIQLLMTAGLSASAMMMAVGCADTTAPTQANSNGVRNDVTDVRPLASAMPASYQPPVYDNSGLIPTAAQSVTPPPSSAVPVADAATPLMSTTPSEKTFGEKTYGEKKHTVRKGETLYSIARVSLGSGKLWKKLAAANPGVSAASLKVGQVLVMPS